MLATIMLFWQVLTPALLSLQNGTPLSEGYRSLIANVNSSFICVYMVIICIFYVVAITIAYLGYREFKHMLQSKNR